MNKQMKLSEHLASPSVATLGQTSKLDGARLSPHFTLGEMTKTSYHTKDGNIPPRTAIENLKNLCQNWLEDLRYSYNRLYGEGVTSHDPIAADVTSPNPSCRRGSECRDIPVIINSAYRSEEVNERCGGSRTSNHLTGCAADIRCMGPEQMIRYAGILVDIADGTKRDWDELLLEKRGTTYWIHFAVRPEGNRRRIAFDMR